MKDSKKCTSKDHDKTEANSFCDICKIYICKKCENMHSIIFPNHKIYNINEDLNQIFTGICKEKNHSNKLNYFCKTHNVLCCAECISPITEKDNGQHKDCELYTLDEIKEEKKNKLNNNMKILEQLSSTVNESIKELKNIFEKINTSKENIKSKVLKVFTKLRNGINAREDEIMFQIDNKFDELFFKEDIVKECDKLPNKIKVSLEKGKNVDNEWNKNQNQINSLINDCLNIENMIKNINDLNEAMNKCKSLNININFIPDENNMNEILKTVKNFGKIVLNHLKFKKCPENINQSRIYKVSGKYDNIVTKTGTDGEWMGTITEKELDKSTECTWKIKVLEPEINYEKKKKKKCDGEIMIGVAPIDFDINSSMYTNCGWYYCLEENSLFSGPPHNYNNKEIIIEKKKESSSDSEEEKPKKKKKKESSSEYEEKKPKKKKKKLSDSEDSKKKEQYSKNYMRKKSNRKKSKKEEESSDSDKKKKKSIKKSISSKKESFSNSDSESDSESINKKHKNIREEITVILNFEEKKLKFMKNNELIGEYNDIIIDKPLFPAVFLYNLNKNIEIEGFC